MMHRAFTIVELLVVTIIISLLALIAIPAFNAIIHDSERSLAEEALQTAFRTARAAALKSAGDQDTALVFHYVRTPDGGRTTMVVCRRVGWTEDFDTSSPVFPKIRDVFVPVPDVDPIQLPKGWMVRGYAPFGSIPGQIAASSVTTVPSPWYESRSGPPRIDTTAGNWVFPETDFYDVDDADDGEDRQTFVLRFEAGSGKVSESSSELLVLSPRPSQEDRNVPTQYRVDDAENDARVVRAILTLPLVGSTPNRLQLLGSRSGDTILAKSVGQVALYNERELAAALGVRLDRTTGCLYAAGLDPRYVTGVDPARVNAWIEGDTNFDGRVIATGDDADTPLARLYAVDRHTAFLARLEVLQ